MFLKHSVFATIAVILCVSSLRAAGTTDARLLTFAADARSAAMGEAFTAVADDLSAMDYNPAGLGTIYHGEIGATNNERAEGAKLQGIGVAYSLRDVQSVNIYDMGTIACSLRTYTSGEAADGALPPVRVLDQVASFSYGKAVFSRDDEGKLFAGAGVKSITEEIDDRKTYNMAYDAGLLWRSVNNTFSLGASVLNVGEHTDTRFELPLTYKGGAAYRLFNESLLFSGDVVCPSASKSGVSLGGEYYFNNTIALRAGYNSLRTEGDGLAVGFGLKISEVDIMFLYARDITIDYSFVPGDVLENTHRLSLILKLGAD